MCWEFVAPYLQQPPLSAICALCFGFHSRPEIIRLSAGFVSCKKKNWNAKNMASAGALAYMGVLERCPQRSPGQSPWSGRRSPPEAEGILLPKRANLNIIHYWFIKFCSYMPKRTGTVFRWSKKEQERRSGEFRLERNPAYPLQTCYVAWIHKWLQSDYSGTTKLNFGCCPARWCRLTYKWTYFLYQRKLKSMYRHLSLITAIK